MQLRDCILTIALAMPVLAPCAAQADETESPVSVAAQLYIWTQHYAGQGERMEDHLDDVFAATRRAGFDAVQGWLSFYDTPESTRRVADLLKQHQLTMPAAYAGGTMHTREGGRQAIRQILRQARLGRPHGLKVVVHNPQPLAREKTDEELAVQADHLDELGGDLQKLGMRLAIHTHDPEMRSQAREWYHILRHTDPDEVFFCLDLHWVYRGKQDPYLLLQHAGRRVIDLHLRNSRDNVWSEELGDGDINYARVKRILDEMGYSGMYTVELAYEAKTKRNQTVEESLTSSRQYVRRVLGK